MLLDNPKRFDPAELWGIVEREKPTAITIVGDSFAQADAARAGGERQAGTTSRRSG